MADHDHVQHGIDDNPTGDAGKGAKLGGVGGAVTGLVAGAAAGPVGAVIGAVVGGVAGAVASGAAVAAVDAVDNDNTISGIGHDHHYREHYDTNYASSGHTYEQVQPSYHYGQEAGTSGRYSNDYSTHESDIRSDFQSRYPSADYDTHRGAIQTGYDRARSTLSGAGATGAGATAGGATGEVRQGTNAEVALGGNGVPGIQTGGTSYDGTAPDTRGITEKIADKLTGDHTDDKTGKAV